MNERHGLTLSEEEAGGLERTFAGETADGLEGLARKYTRFSPTTAHILGGCCMGATAEQGVIDAQHHVHGYDPGSHSLG